MTSEPGAPVTSAAAAAPAAPVAPGAPVNDIASDDYRLLSIVRADAPSGSEGRDWFEYRIVQGTNVIKGYRRGKLTTVTEELKRVVDGLNERRLTKRARVDLIPTPTAKPTAKPFRRHE